MIRVVVADDHHLVRQGIRALLEQAPNFQVVSEAQDGQEAYDQVLRYLPDVLVLDISMPKLNGIEVTRRIKEKHLHTQVLILSMFSDDSTVIKAFRNGARGYVLKKSVAEDLLRAVQTVSQFQNYLTPALERTFEKFELLESPLADDESKNLTDREREVCQLIAEGLTNQAIAYQLGISIKTVEKHRTNLMKKLGVQDVVGLVREALACGIIFFESKTL